MPIAPVPTVPPALDPDDVPVAVGAMCGACGSGRYMSTRRCSERAVCVRCGNGRPLAAA